MKDLFPLWLALATIALALALTPRVAAAAAADAKTLCSFEAANELADWSGGSAAEPGAERASRSYKIAPGATAVFNVPAPKADWSAYRHLKIDFHNPGEVVLINFRFHDAKGRNIMAFEYNIYAGRTTQHIRIDGLRNNLNVGAGIDTKALKRVQVIVRNRRRHDRSGEGVYIDNLRLSTRPTEPYREYAGGRPVEDVEMKKPPGFYLPEFPGMDAGYHTWAIDPKHYQILAPAGSGRDGKGRALEFKPLDVDSIKIWDSPRTFVQAGTYVVEYWVKGRSGATFVDHTGGQRVALSPEWKRVKYEFAIGAGGKRRFIFQAKELGGRSAWMDDLTVCLKGATGNLEPKSKAKGKPSVVTWADGVIYINGKPTFMLGFLRGKPERLRGTPFNLCAPGELTQPEMGFLDKCAEYGLYTMVNLTAPMRAIAPECAARFAKKYKDHPALFAYYLCDEPDHASPSATSEAPVLARATEILHALDPNHPTHALVIPWCASNIYRYRDVVDVLSADRYAVKGTANNNELWTVWRANDAMRRSGTEGQPNIFTPKAQGNITREENWAQAYMCVAAGAAGIMWFEFGGAQRKWSDFVELGKELRSIEHFLVGVELEKGLAFRGDGGAVKGIGRASRAKTALITVNTKPAALTGVKITAPFLSHARSAKVMFENRTVPVRGGVITDDFEGLERHVYVVDGIPRGVKQRPVPKPGGAHVTDAGKAWRIDIGAVFTGRSAAETARDRYMEAETRKAEAAIERGDKATARRIYQRMLGRYPDAQDIKERLRSM